MLEVYTLKPKINLKNCMRLGALRVEVSRLQWHILLLRQWYFVTED
jgi:hypothetical protein